MKLTIQKEVLNGAILQQAFVVEFTVNTQMCTDCHRQEAKDFWKANVQVRQKVVHKKTLLYLEQLILKHKAHAQCVAIKQVLLHMAACTCKSKQTSDANTGFC